MKTFTFSKADTEYLQTLDNMMNAMNVAIQVYVVNNVYKRLGLQPDTKARYDLGKGELYVLEETDLKPVTEKPVTDTEKPVTVEEKTEPPKAN